MESPLFKNAKNKGMTVERQRQPSRFTIQPKEEGKKMYSQFF